MLEIHAWVKAWRIHRQHSDEYYITDMGLMLSCDSDPFSGQYEEYLNLYDHMCVIWSSALTLLTHFQYAIK